MASRNPDDITFRDFKTKLSEYYEGKKYRWLRLCLFNHIPGSELTRTDIPGNQLFNILENQGNISTNNVTILSEIAELTGEADAISHINEYKKSKKIIETDSIEILAKYRQQLFKAAREVGSNELSKVIAHYRLDDKEFTNIWDVIFYLERQKLLDESKVVEFANLLNAGAKDILLGSSSVVTDSVKKDSTSTKQQLIFKELSEDKLLEMLDQVSDWWKRLGNINKLKVLLGDVDGIDDAMVVEGKKPVHMFTLLQARGLITESNIDVLIEAVKLCGLQGVKGKIEKYIPEFKDLSFDKVEYRIFSKHRQNLVKFGNMLNNVTRDRIVHLFQVDIDKADDQWVLIYQLEQMNKLTDEQEIKKAFIERLINIGLKREAEAFEY